MKTGDVIWDIIDGEAIRSIGLEKWMDHIANIGDQFKVLQPDKPEDNTMGFIAFNVPDKARMKLKTGRFLTRKLSLNSGFLPDSAIQQIAEKINLALFGNVTLQVKLLRGKDITQAYRNAIGSRSCMTNDCAEYTRLYEMNPERFTLLVMCNGNNSARAIVHKLDNGEYYMDRIYSDSNTLVDEMRKYADVQGWLWSNTKPSSDILCVSDLVWEDGCVPYQDTMQYGSVNSKGNLNISASNGELNLTSTDGCIEDGRRCESCGDRVSEDDSFPVGDYVYCETCYCDHFSTCEYCDESVPNDDVVHIKDKDAYYCEYCAERHARVCANCEEYFAEDMIELHNGDYVCEGCFKDKYTGCDDCGNVYLFDDTIRTADGDIVCPDCAEDYQCCEKCEALVNCDELTDGKCEDCIECPVETNNGQAD